MADSKHGIRKAEQRNILPEIDLLPVIKHNGKKLDIAVFGPNNYNGNLDTISKDYFHSKQLPKISFIPATISESISAIKIFNPERSQLGYFVKTIEGIFTNTTITNEKFLRNLLGNMEKIKGIYLGKKDSPFAPYGFAPYGSFKGGIQDVETFVQGGLARVLEHAPEEIAHKLEKIISNKDYLKKVSVLGFNPTKEPTLMVADLSSDNFDDRLDVLADDSEGFGDGCSFGVLNKSQSDAPKNK